VLAIVSWIVGVPLLVLGGFGLLPFTVDVFDPDATGFEIIAGTAFVAGSWPVFTAGSARRPSTVVVAGTGARHGDAVGA
jgi:hypothetical protein